MEALADDEWLAAREERVRGVVVTLFGLGALLNLVSEVADIDGSVWHAIRLVVVVAFFAALVPWLGALLWQRTPRRRTWARRARIVGLTAAAATLVVTLIASDVPAAVAVVALGGALAYELLTEQRRGEGTW